MSNKQSALIGFAVLRANYNSLAPSYVDNFQSFVLDSLVRRHPGAVTKPDVASDIENRFGLSIPVLVVGKILKRVTRNGFAIRSDEHYTATTVGLSSSADLESEIESYARQQRDLVNRFDAYVLKNYPDHYSLLEGDVSVSIASYLENHAVPLLAQSMSRVVKSDSVDKPGIDYLISKFIADLSETDQTGFSYVVDAAKGAILASVVTLDTSSFKSSLSGLKIYLDTPLLIKLLSFQGAQSQLAVKQVVDLAIDQGATIACFEHSVQELDGVLQSAEAFLRGGGRREILRPIELYFQEANMAAADVAIERGKLADSLRLNGIVIKKKPDAYIQYGLDETALEDTLQDFVHYKNVGTRRYDVDSISAIHRLRRGSSVGQLERCGSLLLTDNGELARAAQSFRNENHSWPLASLDSTVASILWARSPASNSELPRDQLLATAYAGMQPDSHLWAKYLDEVSKLADRGALNGDEAIILRSTTVAQSALMEATLGVDAEVSEESAREVLERIRETIEQPLLAKIVEEAKRADTATAAANETTQSWIQKDDEIDSMSSRLASSEARASDLESAVNELQKQRSQQINQLRSAADRFARRCILLVFLSVGLPFLVAASLNFLKPSWLANAPGWVGVLCLCCGVGVFALGVLRAFKKGTVSEWLQPFERWLSQRSFENRMRKSGLVLE